ncbi:MAG: carboxypeptidase-like regulatory domain-containing protein [Candidatus Micrarchaeia archaeon]
MGLLEGARERLSGFLGALNERYYSLMDSLQERGIKVYDWFVNPLEERGIPSLPVLLVLLLAFVAGAFLAFNPLQSTVALEVSVYSQNEPLAGVPVIVSVAGNAATAFTGADGIARFGALPQGADALITIKETGYGNYEKRLELAPTDGGAVELRANLEAIAKPAITVLVTDSSGTPLAGATLSYSSPATGEPVEKQTDASGSVRLEYSQSNEIYSLYVTRDGFVQGRVTCFASGTECVIELEAEADAGGEQGGALEPIGTVVVRVKNAAGEKTEATVALHDANSPAVLASSRTSQGVAVFRGIAAGTSVYVSVQAEGYLNYNGGTAGDEQTVSSAGDTLFSVILATAGSAGAKQTRFTITDAEGAPVQGAYVKLYSLNEPLALLEFQSTDAAGDAIFELDADALAYASIYADGFLPRVEQLVEPGAFKTFALEPLAPGNNAPAKITVLDADNGPVPQARVFILAGDGFVLALPYAQTLEDGSVTIDGLPLEGLRAQASKGASHGESDEFQPASGELAEATVTFAPLYGRVLAIASDASQPGTGVNALVRAFIEGEEVASCQSNATQCELDVRANKPVTLKFTATNYAETITPAFSVAPEETVSKAAQLVPLALANQLFIVSFELIDPANGQPVPEGAPLERGKQYDAVLYANLPQGADASGFRLSLEGPQEILFYSAPEDAEASSGSNTREASCDYWTQDGAVRWVNLEFTEGFGVRALSARILVSPQATKTDELAFEYRAYATDGGLWYRNPFDESRNYSAGETPCVAPFTRVERAVTEGSTTCNEYACLSLVFDNGVETRGNALPVEIGAAFSTFVEARFYGDYTYPYLSVAADETEILFTSESFHNESSEPNAAEFTRELVLDGLNSDGGEISALALVASRNAEISFELGYQDGVLLSTTRRISITGEGELVAAVTPQELEANQDNELTVTVYSGTGSPVEDALVELLDGEGAPLAGEEYYLAGDGSRGSGENGEYSFEVHPSSPGTLLVSVEREGYASAEQEIAVVATDFLSFEPDAASLSVDCDPLELTVFNELAVAAPVEASFADNACVVLSGPLVTNNGNHSYSFTVPASGSTTLFAEPIVNQDCYLALNSVLEGTGSAYSGTAYFQVDCSALDPVEEEAIEDDCSSADCGACTETQCIDLEGYCQPAYLTLPGGNRSFNGCVDAEPTPEASCSAANCSLCDQQECLALQNQGACLAEYAAGVYARCSTLEAYDCSPGNFDFSNILARRLAQYHADALLNPAMGKRVIAASASNQVLITNYGYSIGATGPGCDKKDNSIVCDKPVNAMFPINGMTFSVQTTLGQQISVLAGLADEEDEDNSCFEVKKVNGDSAFGIDDLAETVRGTLGAIMLTPEAPYATYLVTFKGTDPECVDYSWENGLRMTPKSNKDTFTIELEPTVYGGGQLGRVTLTLNMITEDDSEYEDFADDAAKYALFAVPASGTIYSRGATVEPVFITANAFDTDIMITHGGSTTELGEAGIAFVQAKLGDAFELDVNGVNGTGFAFAPASTTDTGNTIAAGDIVGSVSANALTVFTSVPSTEEATADVPALPSTSGTIINGGTFDNSDSETSTASNDGVTAEGLACSGTEWCTPEQAASAAEAAQADLQELYVEFYESLDRVDSSGLVQGSEEVFNQALNDAIGDYAARSAVYQACKAAGTDPLAGLQEDCTANYFGPGLNANPSGFQTSEYPQLSAPVPASWQAPQGFGSVYGNAFTQTACNSELMNYGMGSTQAMGSNFWNSFTGTLTGQLTPYSGEVATGQPILSFDEAVVVIPMKVAGVGIVPFVFSFDAVEAGLAEGDVTGQDEDRQLVHIIDTIDTTGSVRAASLVTFIHKPDVFSVLDGGSPESNVFAIPYINNAQTVVFAATPNLFTMNKYPMTIAPECAFASLNYWTGIQSTSDATQSGVFDVAEQTVETLAVTCNGVVNTLTINALTNKVTVGSGANALFECLLDESKTLAGTVSGDETSLTCDGCTCTLIEEATEPVEEVPVEPAPETPPVAS